MGLPLAVVSAPQWALFGVFLAVAGMIGWRSYRAAVAWAVGVPVAGTVVDQIVDPGQDGTVLAVTVVVAIAGLIAGGLGQIVRARVSPK